MNGLNVTHEETSSGKKDILAEFDAHSSLLLINKTIASMGLRNNYPCRSKSNALRVFSACLSAACAASCDGAARCMEWVGWLLLSIALSVCFEIVAGDLDG